METPKIAVSLWREAPEFTLSGVSKTLATGPVHDADCYLPQTLQFPLPVNGETEGDQLQFAQSTARNESAALEALARFDSFSKVLLEDPSLALLVSRDGLNTCGDSLGKMFSSEFLRGALEMYRLGEKAAAAQLKSRAERSKEGRKVRVKCRKTSLKLSKALKF